MQKILFGFLALISSSALLKNAHAQDVIRMANAGSPSVEVYSFDDPPAYVEYDSAFAQRSPQAAYTPEMKIANQSGNLDAPEIKPTKPSTELWGADWSGRINFGASLQTGNTEQDAINADGTVKAKWLDLMGDIKHRATLQAEYNRETEDDVTTEDNRSLEGQYDYFFARKWFLNTNAKFEQDDISDIDLRYNIGVGLGHQVFEQDDLHLQYVLGPTYLREEYEDGSEDDSIAARWAFDYDQKVLEDKFQLFHEHEFLVPVDETDAFLFDSKSGIRMPIIYGVVGTAEVDFDWDNDPEPGIEEDDTTYALKLGYEWD